MKKGFTLIFADLTAESRRFLASKKSAKISEGLCGVEEGVFYLRESARKISTTSFLSSNNSLNHENHGPKSISFMFFCNLNL
jgi:hypothetical protein